MKINTKKNKNKKTDYIKNRFLALFYDEKLLKKDLLTRSISFLLLFFILYFYIFRTHTNKETSNLIFIALYFLALAYFILTILRIIFQKKKIDGLLFSSVILQITTLILCILKYLNVL